MKKVVCLGSAVLDVTAGPIDQIRSWQEKQRIDRIFFSPGGDAVNQCLRMADMGMKAYLLSSVGEDRNADILTEELKRRKVHLDYLRRKEEYPTGTALVLLDGRGERRIFSVRGAYCELEKEDVESILDSDVAGLSIAGLFTEPKLEQGGGMEALLQESVRRKIPVFADLANDKFGLGREGIRLFLPYITYFLPSLSDAQRMNHVKSAEENAVCFEKMGCPRVILKCAEKGCYVHTPEWKGWVPARKVQPVDTTGAGDCMVALFLCRVLKGESVKEAAEFACAGATMSTLHYGASGGRLTEDAIRQWRKNGKIVI